MPLLTGKKYTGDHRTLELTGGIDWSDDWSD
jgi:hypothetical protein